MNRNQRRQEKYSRLRHAGFSRQEASRFKDLKESTIVELIKYQNEHATKRHQDIGAILGKV
jgi:hypothetical protein